MEPMETIFSPAYMPGRQFSHGRRQFNHGSSSALYESPLDLSINTIQQVSPAMIPDPENISIPHGCRFLEQPGSSSGDVSQTHLMYSNVNGTNESSFSQPVTFDVHSSRRMPILFPYGHPPSISVNQSQGTVVFNQNSYAQHMPSSLSISNRHMTSWTAKKDSHMEEQGSGNGPKNGKGYQPVPVAFSSSSYGLNSSEQSANILNTNQVYNTNRLSPLVLPSAVAPSPLPHIRKKEGADGSQKDSPRTARDFPDQPSQTPSFPRMSCTATNISENSMVIDSCDLRPTKVLKPSQLESHICVAKNSSNHISDETVSDCMLSSIEMLPSFKQTSEDYLKESPDSVEIYSHISSSTESVDSNSITTMPRLKAVSPSGHRSSTENSTSPLGPPPLIAAVDSSSGTTPVPEQNSDVPKLLPQVFQCHDPAGNPSCSNPSTMLNQSKYDATPCERKCSTTLSETISVILENNLGKTHVFHQGEHLSLVLQLQNSATDASDPRYEYCRQKCPDVSLAQPNFFCSEQKFKMPVHTDHVINKHHSSSGDAPPFSSHAHPVWSLGSSGQDVADSKSAVTESSGMPAVQLNCRPYICRIKAEKSSPFEMETSDVEDLKPVTIEAPSPSLCNNQKTESFCNGQGKIKSEPNVIETAEESEPLFIDTKSQKYPFFPKTENGKGLFITYDSDLCEFDFNDQTHLISSLTPKHVSRRSDFITYAEIHPVPKEFLGTHWSIGTSPGGFQEQQSCFPNFSPHSDSHFSKRTIKKEPIETGSSVDYHDHGGINNTETSLPLNNEEYSVPSVMKQSIAIPVVTRTSSGTSSLTSRPIITKLVASSTVETTVADKSTASSLCSGIEKASSFMEKQKDYILCKRIQENQVTPDTHGYSKKTDPRVSPLHGLKRKLNDLKISVLSTSHSQPKKLKEYFKNSGGYIKENIIPCKEKNAMEQSQMLGQHIMLQVKDSQEKAVDASSDCERTRRTTFIDFKPEVLESRTRHQKNNRGHLQGRRGKRKTGHARSRRRQRKGPKFIPSKNSRKTKFQKSPKKLSHQHEPSSCFGEDNRNSAMDRNSDSGTENVQKCNKDLPDETVDKDEPSQSSERGLSPSFQNSQNLPLSSCTRSTELHMQEKSKNNYRHQTKRRRRLKSGLDMIRKKKSCSKKTILPLVFKEQKIKRKPDVTDLKKLIVNKSLGESALHRAARQGNSEVVELCVTSKFCSVNSTDNAGYSPLHEACSKGHLEVARILLQNGADVNACATGGVRPIHDAVENDHVEVVRLLLSYGADPTLSTYSGRTLGSFSKSMAMTEFLRGFFSDAGYLSEMTLSDLPCTSTTTWSFAGSAGCLDPSISGCDVLGSHSIDSDSLPDADQEFLFEISEKDFIPTFLFRLNPNKKSEKYVLLHEVLKFLGISEVEFVMKFPDVTIITVPQHEFRARAVCCQILVNPDFPQNSYNVQILLYTERVRSILGIEAMYITL